MGRVRFGVLAVLFLMSGSLFCQENPTVDQMKQMLDVSQRRGQLAMDGGAPFHLVASFESFDHEGRSTGKGTIDELWEGPTRYRQSLTLPDGRLLEVDNGTQLWRTGTWTLLESISLGMNSVLAPFYARPATSQRLSYEVPPKTHEGLECIGTEPDLPGISNDVRLAMTTYCMERGNHLIRLVSRPNSKEITFNNVEPFGKKFIARSVQVGIMGRVVLQLHVNVLEAADNFDALAVIPPVNAQLLSFHRADRPYVSGELMRGQLLKKVSPLYPQAGLRGQILVKLHIDTTGVVNQVEIIKSENQILEAPVLTAVKQWKFRVSYQGTKPVPVDTIYTFSYGGDSVNE